MFIYLFLENSDFSAYNFDRSLSQRANNAPYAPSNQTSSFKNNNMNNNCSNSALSSPLVAYMQLQKQKDAEASSTSSSSSGANTGAVPVQRILKTPSKRDSSLGMLQFCLFSYEINYEIACD